MLPARVSNAITASKGWGNIVNLIVLIPGPSFANENLNCGAKK